MIPSYVSGAAHDPVHLDVCASHPCAPAALRVPLPVTCLTVYRQLRMTVRIVFAQRRIRNNAWAGHFG